MPSIFLYGTLCWADLLKRVGGATCPDPVAAQLPDHQVFWANGGPFPMIKRVSGHQQSGHLLRDCDADTVARLDHYESGFGYDLHPVTVCVDGGTESALVYYPPDHIQSAQDWDLDHWIATHGPLALEASTEVMHRLGHDAPVDVVRKYPMMQVRASQRLIAQDDPSPASPSGLGAGDVCVHNHTTPYVNFFAMGEMDIQVPKFEGGISERVKRAGFLGTDAAIVLPYDPIRDRVLLVEQFRFGPFLRSDANPWMMEPVAGRVDAGETAADTAHRETIEEAGVTLTKLHLVHKGYPSPGCSSEYFNIYVGQADLPDGVERIGGLDTEAEDIKGYLLDWETFFQNLQAGQYPVLPLATAGYWLALNRDRLRGAA